MINFKFKALAALAMMVVACQALAETAFMNLGNERVLICNNDSRSGRGNPDPITDQDYWLEAGSGGCYWTHDAKAVPRGYNAYRKGVNHVMYDASGRELWRIVEGRLGSANNNKAGEQYLPSAPTAVPTLVSGTQYSSNGEVLLSNTNSARIVSSVLEHGVGSIYFDAVNTSATVADQYLRLEVATTQHDGQDLVDGADEDACDWVQVPMDVFRVRNGATVELVGRTQSRLLLDATAGGSDEFFRVKAKFNYYGPARVRIVRDTMVNGSAIERAACMIAVDNVVASCPPNTVRIKEFGAVNPELTGSEVVGMAAAFTSPFPASGEEGVKARMTVEPVYNGVSDVVPTAANAQLHYRWRYLEQEGVWRVVDLVDGGDGAYFESADSLDLGDGVGDVEYFFTADVDGSYYRYVDWALGKAISVSDAVYGEGWLERPGALSHTAGLEEKNAAGTYNFFLRLRQGASGYERMNVVVPMTVTNMLEGGVEGPDMVEGVDYEVVDVSVTNRMELVGNHVWRGFVPTPTGMVGDVSFRFEGRNFTTNGAFEVADNLTRWAAGLERIEAKDLPYHGTVSKTSQLRRESSAVEADAAQGYLMFELNDETLVFVVTRADYQNFNEWTDCLDASNNGLFSGGFTATSGVSRVKQSYPLLFTNITDSSTASATNYNWTESFYHPNQDTDLVGTRFERNIFRKSTLTPNSWTAEQGMYVAELYRTNGLAFQLAGCGLGAISLQPTTPPAGVDAFSFDARLCQFRSFDDYAYNVTKTTDRDYAFTARATMSVEGFAGISPSQPSISLVGYYRPGIGGYEMRVTRTDPLEFELAIYKWMKSGTQMTSTRVAQRMLTPVNFTTSGDVRVACTNWLTQANYGSPMKFYNMYLRVNTELDGSVSVSGGISQTLGSAATQMGDDTGALDFFEIEYADSNPGWLTQGAYGVGSCNCRSYFNMIQRESVAPGAVWRKRNGVSERDEILAGNWCAPPGRMETYHPAAADYGVRGTLTPQTLQVYVSEIGRNVDWQPVPGCDVTVTGFNNVAYSCPVKTVTNCYVRLQHAGDLMDARTDVVVDNLAVTAFRGKPTEDIDAGVFGNYTDDRWVWTETWLESVPGTLTGRAKAVLDPKRAMPGRPLGLRSPWLNGLSALTFRYENAGADAVLKIQVSTNATLKSQLGEISKSLAEEDWTTWKTVKFSGAGSANTDVLTAKSGSYTAYFPFREPAKCLVRVIMDPAVANAGYVAADSSSRTVTITQAYAWDEPAIDGLGWWGWNMLTTHRTTFSYLTDPVVEPRPGLSCALNNSIKDTVVTIRAEDFKQHNPFVQSPYAERGIGGVSFKARKYYPAAAVDPVVTLLGAPGPNADEHQDVDGNGVWKVITNFTVSASTYTQYDWSTASDTSDYKCIRLMVAGVTDSGSVAGEVASSPVQRVLLDEIVVSEPVAPKITFESAMPFRSDLAGTAMIRNFASSDEQPLAGENFGIQAVLRLQQMDDELDPDSLVVHCAVFEGRDPWGYENWKDLPGVISFDLPRASDSNLVFRSTLEQPDTVLPLFDGGKGGVTVQYMVWAEYRTRDAAGGDKSGVHYLTREDWTGGAAGPFPKWYWPLDLNRDLGDGGSEEEAGSFSAYTLLDSVSPYRVWFNEVNLNDAGSLDAEYDPIGYTNQFIEVAVPQGADLTGWKIRAWDYSGNNQYIAEFGWDGVRATPVSPATNHYCFMQLQSPETAIVKGGGDGVWSGTFPTDRIADGRYNYFEPYGFELVRPSGVIDHQIVVQGTNVWYEWDFDWLFDGTNLVADLQRWQEAGSTWFLAGRDTTDGTVGVMRGHGEDGDWEVDLMPTPGEVNRRRDGTLQDIDEDWYIAPNGTNVWLYCSVMTEHLMQTAGLLTNKQFVVIVQQGGSTNIVYKADPWWVVGSITTGGVEVAAAANRSEFTLNLENVSNSFDIVARAVPSPAITNGTGIAVDNPYLPSVVQWLEDNFDEDELRLAELWKRGGGSWQFKRDLTLTEMYWLDIPPVAAEGDYGWRLYADFDDPVTPYEYVDYVAGEPHTIQNLRTTFFMMITNTATGEAHAPATLQTYGNVSSAEDYEESGLAQWKGVTFMISASLPEDAPDVWVPLRYLVFGPDSFGAPGAANEFRSVIDLWDPFDNDGAGYDLGWSIYHDADPRPAMNFRWYMGDERLPGTVEMLKADSTFPVQEP